jgi:hypothetical protein
MKKTILGDKIVVYHNVSETPMSIIEAANEITVKHPGAGFRNATINNHQYDTNLRSCTVFSLFTSKLDKSIAGIDLRLEKVKLNQKIISQTSLALIDFIKEYGFKIVEREAWELLSYEETQKLTWHSDNGAPHPCLVSMVYYLNDDYEGGEVEFKDHIGTPFKPSAGDLLIFPSSVDYVHRVLPITSGRKYAAISFCK